MPRFVVTHEPEDDYGRLGELDVPHGPVETPALFPVMSLIGGPTPRSGGIWRWVRDELLASGRLSGIMFQAMSFTDFDVRPEKLNEFWRTKPFHDHYDIDSPVFIDSGGFKLMNSDTFGTPPEKGGSENDWGVYTNPESILGLQADFGADILATLDYPIPPNLKEDEKVDRMQRSIESAVRCLELLENPDELAPYVEGQESISRLKSDDYDPNIFIALHGHDYETINWYVANFLDRIQEEDVSRSFQGFAIGSLVPLRSQVDVLVDIVQGAKDAIPEAKQDEIGLHVFGVAGKLAPLLALLGVDSFDCSSHIRAAQYKKYILPDKWKNVKVEDLEPHLEEGEFPCDIDECVLCGDSADRTHEWLDYEELREGLYERTSYVRAETDDDWNKSRFYALLAQHNYSVYSRELRRIRDAIASDSLLDHVVEVAHDFDEIKRGLKYAQVRDKSIAERLEARGEEALLAGPEQTTFQAKLATFQDGEGVIETDRSVSLEYGPGDFNVFNEEYKPPEEAPILLIIPCSQKKPYSESRTHRILLDQLQDVKSQVHKVTISGLYGPVPESCEDRRPVLEYEYYLSKEDEEQIALVTDRLVEYLRTYGDQFDAIVGYATSKQYRGVIEDAFERHDRGTVLPTDPKALQLTEHFRGKNVDELVDLIKGSIEGEEQSA
jgi:queuine/archaeosine tRNA-ribosyltransferase